MLHTWATQSRQYVMLQWLFNAHPACKQLLFSLTFPQKSMLALHFHKINTYVHNDNSRCKQDGKRTCTLHQSLKCSDLSAPSPRFLESCPERMIWVWVSHSEGRPSPSPHLHDHGDQTQHPLKEKCVRSCERTGQKAAQKTPPQPKSYLLTHSRFWSPRSPSLWPEAGCWSLLVVSIWMSEQQQIWEVWVQRRGPTLDDHNWSSCLLGRSLRSDCPCEREERQVWSYQKTNKQTKHLMYRRPMMLHLSAIGNITIKIHIVKKNT